MRTLFWLLAVVCGATGGLLKFASYVTEQSARDYVSATPDVTLAVLVALMERALWFDLLAYVAWIAAVVFVALFVMASVKERSRERE